MQYNDYHTIKNQGLFRWDNFKLKYFFSNAKIAENFSKIMFFYLLAVIFILSFSSQSFATNKVAAGGIHTIAITTLKKVQCTGDNTFGQCDVTGWTDIEQVAAGQFFSVGLNSDGDVFCAGLINFVACSVAEFSGYSIVSIAAGSNHILGIVNTGAVKASGDTNYNKLDVGSWTNITQVVGGEDHTVGLKSDNTVVCVGNNAHDQCEVSGWSGITQISAGLYYTLGLQTGGTVVFTGNNNHGQGDVTSWTNISQISAGSYHTVAVDDSNVPYATGLNDDGQCDVSTWTVMDELVAAPKNTIGIQADGEIEVIGSTENDTAVVTDWQLVNNPPRAYTLATLSTYEDYAVSTDNLLTLSSNNDYESHTITVVSLPARYSASTDGTIINNGDGTYKYNPDNDYNGSDSFTYTLTDGQSVNYTGTATVSVTITPVNDPPFFSCSDSAPITDEDAGEVCISSWAYDLTAGAFNEGSQTLSITWTCTNESLFLTAPVLSSITANNSALTLTYAFNAEEYGEATLTVVLSDDGGVDYKAYGGEDSYTQTFVLTALSINDAPTFTKGSNLKRPNEDGIINVFTDWARELGKGPTNESGQALAFTVTSSNPALIFTSDPAVEVSGTTGTLSYTLTAGSYGSTTLTVVLWDDGGTPNGGEDSITQTFIINSYYSAHDGPGGVDDTNGSSGLVLWLDASQITGLSDGENLTEWADLSGYANTLTPVSAPTYSLTFTNNMPAVVFNDNYLSNSSALDFTYNSGLGVFAVINANSASLSRTIIAKDAEEDHGWSCKLNDSDKLSFDVAESSSLAVTSIGATSMSGSNTIVSFLYDGLINRTLSVYRGDTNDSNPLSYTIPYYISEAGPTLRVGNDGDNNYFKGSIAELIVFDRAVLTAERILIQNYLSSKYDIALSSDDKYTGDTSAAGDFDLNVAGIGKESDSINNVAVSAGIVITNTSFLQDDGDYILLGHNRESNGLTVTNLPAKVNKAWERVWMVHKTDVSNLGGNIQIAFDFDLADMVDDIPSTDFVLLKRTGSTGTFEILSENASLVSEKVTFTVDTTDLNTGDCLTIGSIVNYALQFNGVDQYLISETAVALAGISFTVEFWAQRSTTGLMYVMGQGPDSWVNFNNLNIGFNASGQAFFGFDDSYTVTTASSYIDTSWHHYAFSYNSNNNIAIYVDGTLELSDVMTGSYVGSGLLNIAQAPGTSNPFEGEIDEIRIWSDARSYEDIFINMNTILDGDESNLLVYWQFNEGIGITTLDCTSSALHQTLSPSSAPPTWVTSSLPVGYSTSAQTETLGTLSFTDTSMSMDYNYHNSETVVVTRISTDANVLPNATSTVYSSQYWIIARTGDSSFNADLTFTVEDNITTSNTKYHKLFWRENGSTGAWAAIAFGSSVNTGTETVVFNSIKTAGQFMVALDDSVNIPGAGYTLDFDGLDDCAVDETNGITLANASFTIEFWAKRNTIGSTHWAIGHTDTAQGLCIGFSSTNAFEFTYSSSTATTGAYTDTDWHHWALTYDSSGLTQTVFCDGIWVTENTASEAYAFTGNFYIGCGANKINHFKGKIDEVRVWKAVRTQNDIQRYMFEPLEGDEGNLIAYWRMDEPWSYTYITDIAANSVNLAVTGTMLVDDFVQSLAWSERTTNEDTEYTLTAGHNPDGTAISLSEQTAPLSGTVTTNGYILSYSPSESINGVDTFTYDVSFAGTEYPITITILPINDAPEIGLIDSQLIAVNAVASVSFTITDLETDADSLTVTSSSSSLTKVADANIDLTCTAGSCSANITPETDVSGQVEITFMVEDPEGLTATSIFALTINNLPGMQSISDLTTTVNTAITPIAFTVADSETANGDLDLTISISNTTLLPANQAVLSNTGGSCTLSITPDTYQEGTATIDVTVTDADGGEYTRSFLLTIIDMPGSGYMMNFGGGSYSATTTQTLTFTTHSVEAWINTTDNAWNGIVATDDSSGKWSQMSVSSTGYLAVQLMNTGGQEKAYSGTTSLINDGNWHHVAYTFESASETLNLYVDGVLEVTFVSNNQALTGFSLTEKIKIGVDSSESSYFSGNIDEVRIWDSVLSAATIRGNMCQKIDPSTGGLLAYYRFDQEDGTTLYDLTSNNNDCNIDGASWALSGASIGNESVYDYDGSVAADFTVNKAHADGDNFTMTCGSGVPTGIHLYLVNQAANTTNDLGSSIQSNRYWGTFIAGSCTFKVNYDYTDNPYSLPTLSGNKLAWRDDNSDQDWDGYNDTYDYNGVGGDGIENGVIDSPSDNAGDYSFEYILYTP